MKKLIFIILALLPVFLIVTITVAGRLITLYVPIPVDSVEFVDDEGEAITELEIGLDSVRDIHVLVKPELASNKNYFFTISPVNTPVFQLNQDDQTVKGLAYGSAKLIVTTQEKKLRSELTITVTDRAVASVALNVTEKTLSLGEGFKLTATVLPHTAVDRVVRWTSSSPETVSVDANGNIYAHAATTGEPVIITATTRDGDFTAECAVTVLDNLPTIAFFRTPTDTEPVPPSESIVVRTASVSLADFIRHSPSVSFDDIIFTVTAGGASVSGSQLTFTDYGYANIQAKVTVLEGENLVEHVAKVTILYMR